MFTRISSRWSNAFPVSSAARSRISPAVRKARPKVHRILEIYFESTDAQTEALMSPMGQEAGKELRRLPDDSYQLLLADVYEEAGGNTPQPDADEEAKAPVKEDAAEDETVSAAVPPSSAD